MCVSQFAAVVGRHCTGVNLDLQRGWRSKVWWTQAHVIVGRKGAMQPGSVFKQSPFVPQVCLRQAKVIRAWDPVDCSPNTRYGTE